MAKKLFYDVKHQKTGKHLSDLLPKFIKNVEEVHRTRPDLLLAAWPSFIGKEFASMTKALSFEKGILTVKVNNSTLYSLLSQHEKAKIVKRIKEKFPSILIRDICFRMG